MLNRFTLRHRAAPMLALGALACVACASSSNPNPPGGGAPYGADQGPHPGGPPPGGPPPGGPPPGGGPPPEAFEACADRGEGIACTVTMDNKEMTGFCAKHPQDDRIICRPGGPPPGGPPSSTSE